MPSVFPRNVLFLYVVYEDTSKSRRYNDRFDEVRHENTKRTDGYQKYHKRRNSCDHEDRYNRHKHKKEDSQNREDHVSVIFYFQDLV